MALTSIELTQWVQDKINANRLSWTAQNDVSFDRGLHHKYDQQLLDIIEQYKNKYKRLIERYKESLDDIQGKIANFDISQAELKDEILGLKDNVIRMADKYWAVKWEIEGRRLNIFKRTPVGTIYYIDLDGGNDSADGLSTGNAWLTLEKYTTVTVRSPGDIAYVRANTDEIPAGNIVADEYSYTDFIQIIGCDSVINDPWSDGSDVKPIVNFNALSTYLRPADGWKFTRMVYRNTTNSIGNIEIDHEIVWWKDCEIKDSSTSGARIGLRGAGYFDGCLFENNTNIGLMFYGGGFGFFKSCTFDGGTGGQNVGLDLGNYGGYAEVVDSLFGQINAHGSCDFYIRHNSQLKIKNTKYNTVGYTSDPYSPMPYMRSEDDNGVYGAGIVQSPMGKITKQASPVTGNAIESYKLEPTQRVHLDGRFLTLNENGLIEFPFIIEGTASQQITITIKLQAESAWGTYPTASELYIEASYYDSGSDAGRSTIASTQVISSSGTWVSFTVTMTPLRNGPIYVNVYLKKYESGKSITVNGEAVTS